MTETTLDLGKLLETPELDANSYNALKEAAFSSSEDVDRFIGAMNNLLRTAESGGGNASANAMKAGLCLLLVGDTQAAIGWLEKAKPSALRSYHLGIGYRDLRQPAKAAEFFATAAGEGWNKLDCDCLRAECLLMTGDVDGAAKLVDSNRSQGQSSAQWNYSHGRILQEQGKCDEAVAAYEAALAIDCDHPHAMFHLAYLLDLHGSDERARELYFRCSELPFVFSHALINLAVILEDECKYEKAAACLRRVLTVNPDNARAELYLKDVLASRNMYIDEQQLKVQEKRDAVLDIPVSDFELSVRSRNCLKKMNINTLGDLLRTSEADLLSYKNFGETSLREIKAMLAQKGLSLGQNADRPHEPAPAVPVADPSMFPDANPEVLSRPVSTLELSVRSRKCLQRLGINSIGELAARSEQELLESRNFGQTSLKELQNRLAELGLSFRASS